MRKKSLNLSLSSLIAALCTAIMMSTGLITIGTYALPAIAGIFCVPIVIEINKKWAVATYVVTSLLSIIIAADKEAVIIFILFFGYYPILKATIEKIKNRWLVLFFKLFIFNISIIFYYVLTMNLLGLPDDAFALFGVSVPLFFLAMGNVTFLLYDYAVSKFIQIYIFKLQPKVKKFLKL